MKEFSQLCERVSDPRRSNATRHDLHEMPMISLLCVLCGGEGCHDMSLFGRSKETFLRRFMVLEHGIHSHDAFSDLFNALGRGSFQPVTGRLLGDFSRNIEGVIAIEPAPDPDPGARRSGARSTRPRGNRRCIWRRPPWPLCGGGRHGGRTAARVRHGWPDCRAGDPPRSPT